MAATQPPEPSLLATPQGAHEQETETVSRTETRTHALQHRHPKWCLNY